MKSKIVVTSLWGKGYYYLSESGWTHISFLFYRYVLSVSMTLLAVAHLHRQITDYGGYTLDLTG